MPRSVHEPKCANQKQKKIEGLEPVTYRLVFVTVSLLMEAGLMGVWKKMTLGGRVMSCS